MRFRLALLIALTLLALQPVLEAHPLAQTRVSARFAPDRTYTIEVLVDPEALLAGIEILSGHEPLTGVPIGELPSRITALRDVLLAHVRVSFDGVAVRPEMSYREIGETPSPPRPPSPPADSGQGARGEVFVEGQGPPQPPGMNPAQTPGTNPAWRSGINPAQASGTNPPWPPGTSPLRPAGIISLTGRVPSTAQTFQFQFADGVVSGAYPLTIDGPSAQSRTVWLSGGQASEAFVLAAEAVAPTRLRVAAEYLVLGFEHIVPRGIDHILFVLGLFLLGTAWRPIFLQVTTFTLAHSITLGLTIYGIVSLPPTIVEPLIALSITYVAIENLFTSTLRPWRIGLVFAFGLLHGMGFAGVLKDLGLPRSEFLTALVTFNLGVEGGQLAVIATALLAVGWWRHSESAMYRRWIVIPASMLIAAVGAYWTIARALGIG